MLPDVKGAYEALQTLYREGKFDLPEQDAMAQHAALLSAADWALLYPTLESMHGFLRDPKLSAIHALCLQTGEDYELSAYAFDTAAMQALVPLLALDPLAPDASATADRYAQLARGEIDAAQKQFEREVDEASKRFTSKRLATSPRRYQHHMQVALDLARGGLHMRDDDGKTLSQGERLHLVQHTAAAFARLAEGTGQPRAMAVAEGERMALGLLLADALPDDPGLSVQLLD